MEFSSQEYWSGSPFPSPGDLPHPGIEPVSPTLQADSLFSGTPGKPLTLVCCEMATTGQQMRIKGKGGPTPENSKSTDLMHKITYPGEKHNIS